jgi:ATP-dependent DNA ligase
VSFKPQAGESGLRFNFAWNENIPDSFRAIAKSKSGKPDLWLKQRFNQEGNFVIGGYIPSVKEIGELLIGECRENKLHFIRPLNAGLNQFNRPAVCEAVQDLETKEMPFTNLPERRGPHSVTEEVMKECVWLKPQQTAEVEFVERTPGGRLRHASFRRLLRWATAK